MSEKWHEHGSTGIVYQGDGLVGVYAPFIGHFEGFGWCLHHAKDIARENGLTLDELVAKNRKKAAEEGWQDGA